MGLTRVRIDADGKTVVEANTEKRVFFNPSQYTISKRVNWKATDSRGLDLPLLQFDSGGTRTLVLALIFDTYEAGTDVRDLTKQVAQLSEVPKNKKRPPVCTIFWGAPQEKFAGLPFVGVVESLTQKFTLFLPDGTPVRATVDLSLRQVESPEKQLKETPRNRSSPLQARTRIAREGDSLWNIAAAEYGDAARWRPIARANRIVDPRRLEPGHVLVVPALE